MEGKLAWQGGRSEEATYEAGDAEDVAASAAAQAQAARQAGEVEVSMRCRPPAENLLQLSALLPMAFCPSIWRGPPSILICGSWHDGTYLRNCFVLDMSSCESSVESSNGQLWNMTLPGCDILCTSGMSHQTFVCTFFSSTYLLYIQWYTRRIMFGDPG